MQTITRNKPETITGAYGRRRPADQPTGHPHGIGDMAAASSLASWPPMTVRDNCGLESSGTGHRDCRTTAALPGASAGPGSVRVAQSGLAWLARPTRTVWQSPKGAAAAICRARARLSASRSPRRSPGTAWKGAWLGAGAGASELSFGFTPPAAHRRPRQPAGVRDTGDQCRMLLLPRKRAKTRQMRLRGTLPGASFVVSAMTLDSKR